MKVYLEGEAYEIDDNKRLYRHPASGDSGCAKAGRTHHKLNRVNCYLTHCVYEDCDFEI